MDGSTNGLELTRRYRVAPVHDARLTASRDPSRTTARAPVGSEGVAARVLRRSPRPRRARGGAHRLARPHGRRSSTSDPRRHANSARGLLRGGERPPRDCRPGAGGPAPARGDRRASVGSAAGPGRRALRRGARSAHLGRLAGRLLSDLCDRSAHLRRQLAAARLDPHAGDGVLDRAEHLPRVELRPLLRRADAVQRHQRPAHHLGAGRRLLRLRAPAREL